MTNPRSLRQRAQGGDPIAIAALINQSFQKYQVRVEVQAENSRLTIRLTGASGPNSKLAATVKKGLLNLKLTQFSELVVMGYLARDTAPIWVKRLPLSVMEQVQPERDLPISAPPSTAPSPPTVASPKSISTITRKTGKTDTESRRYQSPQQTGAPKTSSPIPKMLRSGAIFLGLAIAIGLGVRYLQGNWWYLQTYKLSRQPTKANLCVDPFQESEVGSQNLHAEYYLESGGDPRLIIFECIIDYPTTLALWIEKMGDDVGQAATQIDSERQTLLELAVRKQDYDLVQKLIDYGANVNYTGSILSSNSPVIIAISNDDLQMLKLLVEHGASLTQSQGSIEENRGAILQELNQSFVQDLEDGGDRWEEDIDTLFALSTSGNSLSSAISSERYEIAEYLIDLGVPYDGEIRVSAKSVFAAGRIKISRAMLEGSPELANSSTLNDAVSRQDIELINLLLSKNVQVDSSFTLRAAIEGGNSELIQLFKTFTPQEFLKDPELLIAAMGAQNISEIDYFLNQGIPINQGIPDKSAFEIALAPGSRTGNRRPYGLTVIQHLIGRGADVNRIGHEGYTPLTKMIDVRDSELVDLLLRNGADINQLDGNGQTPLMIAIQERKITLVELLVSRGADVNQPTASGRYPVNEASLVGTGNKEVRAYLLSQGGTYAP
jgi:ankyrin repeat protein